MMYKTYYLALKNDIYIDELAFIETGLNKVVDYNIIKPYLTQQYIKQYPKLSKYIFTFIRFTWVLWNFSIHTISIVKYLLVWLFKSRIKISSSSLSLIATPRLVDQLPKVQDAVPNTGILIGKGTIVANAGNYIRLNRVCSFKDIIQAYLNAVGAPFKLKKILKGNHIIQTYNAFEWFLTFNYLKKLNHLEEIWFGNHCDRWAVLFDNLNITNKIIVQHGIENGKLNPPVKLKNITKIYFITLDQYYFFQSKITQNLYEICELKNILKTSDILLKDKLRVLIIGNSSLYSKEEEHLIHIISKLNVYLSVKPHPVLSNEFYTSPSLKDLDFVLIADRTIFPEVDVVISYESTLGIEYEIEGVQVLYYTKYSIKDIIQKIELRAAS